MDRADKFTKLILNRNIITTHIEAFTWQSVLSQGTATSRNDWYDQMHDNRTRGMVQKQSIITDTTIYRYVNKKLNWLLNEQI